MTYTHIFYKRAAGFTLVELSIVIIIIGFLIAGISAGMSLIQQAKLNSVINEMKSYQVVYNNFKLTYGAVPGDLTNPDAYWPNGASGCAIAANGCDGDGNGIIEFINNAGGTESLAAWRELVLANMINANIVVRQGGLVSTPGTHTPINKALDAGYIMVGKTSWGLNSLWDDDTNAIYTSKVNQYPTQYLGDAALKTQEAFNMDQKIDDGQTDASGNFTGAKTGNFRTSVSNDALFATRCLKDADTNYDISVTALSCSVGLALN
jgi:prepilin-type N-terminal cleavage/methylation domain-containing protein